MTYWALANPWDPDDPNRACFTCGAPPGGRFQDGSPRYPECFHSPIRPEDLPPGWEPYRGPRLTITLSSGDIALARRCAEQRNAKPVNTDAWGARALPSEEARLQANLVGAGGEIAFARLTGYPFRCQAGRGYGKPDIGPYQVRTRRLGSDERLIVHEADDGPVALMVGNLWTFTLAGWLQAPHTWRIPKYADNPGGRRPAWFVPRADLRAPQTLPELASRV